MKRITGNTILITGGGSGIGYGLAKRLAAKGNEVIICGRRKEQLEQAQKETPSLQFLVGDVSTDEERIKLAKDVLFKYPKVNVLVNNAGIQNRLPPLTQAQEWPLYKKEISINFEAPVHLTMLFVPHFLTQPDAAIINVTSGLSFVPFSLVATYAATKAGLHSFTMSLRHQLRATNIATIEVVPPSTNTDLGGKGLHNDGVPLDEFCDHVMDNLSKGKTEFGYGFSEKARLASREQVDQMFATFNRA